MVSKKASEVSMYTEPTQKEIFDMLNINKLSELIKITTVSCSA